MDTLNFKMTDTGVFTATEKLNGMLYQFHVVRKKDKLTGLEVIEIKGGNVDTNGDFEQFGIIITKYADISQKMRELQNYGIMLSITQLGKLGTVIRENYYKIPVVATAHVNTHIQDEAVVEFFEMVCQHIHDNQIEAGKSTYNIRTTEFRKVYEDSNFEVFDLKEWMAALAEGGYTKTNKNRTDYAVKNEGKTEKYYAFYKDKVDEVIAKIKMENGEEE